MRTRGKSCPPPDIDQDEPINLSARSMTPTRLKASKSISSLKPEKTKAKLSSKNDDTPQPEKRGRGRPRKVTTGAEETVTVTKATSKQEPVKALKRQSSTSTIRMEPAKKLKVTEKAAKKKETVTKKQTKKNRPFCNICKLSFDRAVYLYKHTLRLHSTKHPFYCRFCKKGFADSSSIQSHFDKQHKGEGFMCSETNCKKTFPTAKALKDHAKADHKLKPFKCSECRLTFARFPELMEHNASVHSVDDKKVSETVTTKEKPFKCTICTRAFSRPDHVRRHRLIHTEERPFRCHVCSRGFSKMGQLREHCLKRHGVENVKSQKKIDSVTTSGGKLERVVKEPKMKESKVKKAASRKEVKKASVPKVVEKTPIPKSVEKAPIPEAVEKAPIPEVVEKAPIPEAVEKGPIPEAVEKAPIPEAVEKAPIPEAVEKAPIPEAVEKAPIPKAENDDQVPIKRGRGRPRKSESVKTTPLQEEPSTSASSAPLIHPPTLVLRASSTTPVPSTSSTPTYTVLNGSSTPIFSSTLPVPSTSRSSVITTNAGEFSPSGGSTSDPNGEDTLTEVCELCDRKFRTVRYLEEHKVIFHNPQGPISQCPQCDLKCGRATTLWHHYSRHHIREKEAAEEQKQREDQTVEVRQEETRKRTVDVVDERRQLNGQEGIQQKGEEKRLEPVAKRLAIKSKGERKEIPGEVPGMPDSGSLNQEARPVDPVEDDPPPPVLVKELPLENNPARVENGENEDEAKPPQNIPPIPNGPLAEPQWHTWRTPRS